MAFQAVLRPGDTEWPPSLDPVTSPPAPKQLYAIGDVGILRKPCVAIVGSRSATAYGERITREIASALAAAGACVVSGLAFGIDAAAHRAALNAGVTAAVLGAGIDVIYPPSHRKLYHQIAENGLVLSEFAPGTRVFKGCFPRRNRIIAGLCSVIIVIEAGAGSGALITAGYALDFDRKVAAVPGPIDSPESVGSNQLLRDGAHVIASVDDALALLDLVTPTRATPLAPSLGGDEAAAWDIMSNAITTDAMAGRLGWPVSRCLVAVTNLEIQGLVHCSLSGEIRRR